jgi:hypothetical protein
VHAVDLLGGHERNSLSLSHDLLLLLLMQFRAWFSEEARIGKTLTGFQWRRRAA